MEIQSPEDQQRRWVNTEARRGRPEVRPVVQITSELQGDDPETALARARTQILMWLRDKQGIRGMPPNAWDGAPFEMDATQGRPVSVESFDHVWALRYDNLGEGPHGRIWRTEAIVGSAGNVGLVGVRLTTITREWDIPVIRSVPRIVADLAANPGLRDYGVPLGVTPSHVQSDSDVDKLVALLEEPRRTRPVIVVSENGDGMRLIDADQLASRTAGLAHVFTISDESTWALGHLVGKRLSVYGQGIRTYFPGFDRGESLFDEHPLATPQWLQRRFQDSRAFVMLLANQAIDASVTGVDLEARLPSFSKVREWVIARRLEAARKEKAPDELQLRLYEESNASLEEALRIRDGELEIARIDHLRLEEERDEAMRLARNLRARIAFLEQALKARSIVEEIEYPDGYDDLDEWVNRHLGERLTLLSRAARAVKKSAFEDVRLLCDALRLLAGPYRDMRRGELARSEFERECAELGVEVSPTGDETSLMRWREDYEVSWGKGKRLLDLHLKKGTSREPKNCLRIYFFWDDDGEQVVVGFLPGHLTTANS